MSLQEAAACLRLETTRARYTNRDLDPCPPLFTLAELLGTVARKVSIGELHPRNAVRRGPLDLARQLRRKVGPLRSSPAYQPTRLEHVGV